jgi:uncharacterized protein YjbJ (UPF0337 family)
MARQELFHAQRPRGKDDPLGPPVFASDQQHRISGSDNLVCSSVIRRKFMSMNKDQIKGRVNEAKGTVKEAAGKLVGNEKLEVKGKVQKVVGKAQAKFGDVKKHVKESL